MPVQEHRKAKRESCVVPVEGKAGSAFGQIHAIDLSKGGIGFISAQSITLDEQIAVEIDSSEQGDPVLMLGRVQWVEPIRGSGHYRVGMKFIKRL